MRLACSCSPARHGQLRLPAGDLNVAPEARDPDHLNERGFDPAPGEHPHGVRRVVRHRTPHGAVVDDNGDVEGRQVVGGANATEHQQLRAAQRTCGDDHLARRVAVQERRVVVTVQILIQNSNRPRLCAILLKEQISRTTKFLENEFMSQFVSTSRHCQDIH